MASSTHEKMKKAKKSFGRFSMEPLLFLYYFAFGLEDPTTRGLWYWKICMITYNDEWICKNINKNETLEEIENEIQAINSKYNFYDSLCKQATAMISTLFLYGYLSDKVSRKIPIYLPLFGYLLLILIQLYSALNIQSSLGWLLFASFVHGCFGSDPGFFMACMSYVSNVSSIKSRTLRMSITYGIIYAGESLGTTASGVILENTGYDFMYITSFTLICVCFIFVLIAVPDITNHKTLTEDIEKFNTESNKQENSELETKQCESLQNQETMYVDNSKKFDQVPDGEQKESIDLNSEKVEETISKTSETLNSSRTLNDNSINFYRRKVIDWFKSPLQVVFRKREHRHRVYIMAVLFILTFYTINRPDIEIAYLYLKKPPLSFTQAQYGFYKGYQHFLGMLSLLTLIPFLTKVLQIDNSPLLLCAIISCAVEFTLMGFSDTKWMVYLAPILGIMRNGTFTFGRSMLSTLVKVNEIGAIFSVLALLISSSKIFRSALYSFFLYPQTVDNFAGFSYIFAAILLIIPASVAIWMLLDKLKNEKNSIFGKYHKDSTEEILGVSGVYTIYAE